MSSISISAKRQKRLVLFVAPLVIFGIVCYSISSKHSINDDPHETYQLNKSIVANQKIQIESNSLAPAENVNGLQKISYKHIGVLGKNFNPVNFDSNYVQQNAGDKAHPELPDGQRAVNSEAKLNPTTMSTDQKLERIRQMIFHAWKTYSNLAFGFNEYKPVSEKASGRSDLFGNARGLGVFLIDSLDTLILAGFDDEKQRIINWIRDNFKPSQLDDFVSVFEVNIRVLGGLLGAFTLANDPSDKQVLLKAAIDLGNALLPAFDKTRAFLPQSMVNLKTGAVKSHKWLPSCIVLAEAGSLQLEMEYLSLISGDDKYSMAVRTGVTPVLSRFDGHNFIPNMPTRIGHCPKEISIGANGDSFYEYLLKTEILLLNKIKTSSNENPFPGFEFGQFQAFRYSLNLIEGLSLVDEKENSTYFAHITNGQRRNSIGHLFCFTGGMYALAKIHGISEDPNDLARYDRLARALTFTCRRSYLLGNGIGPEQFVVNSEHDKIESSHPSYYILRPEYVESLFYLYRMTGDSIYRDWGWQVVEALEKRCKVNGGYTTLSDVYTPDSQDDDQPTYFLAETLKYLYLLFSDNDILDLKSYVFNTEAHPFKIT